MKRHRKFLVGYFLILMGMTHISCASTPDQERWDVTLSTSSLEAILLNPQKILDDPEEFWKTDSAYILVDKWHKNNRISKDTRNYYTRWLVFLKDLSKVPEEERTEHPAFQLLEALKERIVVFNKKAIPLLNEIIPKNKMKFTTTIYLTGKILSHAFMMDGMIVADVLNGYYHNDPDHLFNMLTHECFHIGYGYNRYLREEIELDNDFIYNTMLDALQNEGMATYVGYLSQDFFPAENEIDFRMLDNPVEIKRQFDAVNDLFSAAEHMQVDSLRKKSWDVGVMQRGYYITGAHVARTIDDQRGRDALIETITMGPLAFVDTYNGLVDETMKVFAFGKSEPHLLIQKLKSAADRSDHGDFENIVGEMKTSQADLPSGTQRRIRRLGWGMLYQENFEWAIAIFEVLLDLFPESAASYCSMAEVHLRIGNKENAIHYYNQALKVDPDFKFAQRKLTGIE